MIELTLNPEAAGRLLAIPGLRRIGRASPVRLEFHDTPGGDLLAEGLVLVRSGARWQLLREHEAWVTPALLAEARDLVALSPAMPVGVVPVASWEGTRRGFRWTGPGGVAKVTVLDGRFDRRGRERGRLPPCRLTLEGPAEAVAALADRLARAGAEVPRTTLARDAMPGAVERPDRGGGVDPAHGPGEALAAIMAGQLRLMQHWAALIPGAKEPEPVHQMRVATRRLRAALSTFKGVAACPELESIGPALKDCAARLGAARDWDVFLAGAGARLAEAFPEDVRCAAMLRSAERRRRVVYRELRHYLAGPEFRVLLAALAHAAALRPWPSAEEPELAAFAVERLRKRFKRVRQDGRGLATMPVPALHELRKDCKRLRYTAEFMAPLFAQKPARRFLRQLAAVQEELGLLNDGAAIAGLMAQLGRADRGYAAGLAEGFTAARSGATRGQIGKAWKRLLATRTFWPSSTKRSNALSLNKDD